MTAIPAPHDELERRLIRALETSPKPVIPSNFAQRVAAAAPAHPLALPARPPRMGIRVAWASAALLLLAICAMPHTPANWLQLTFEFEFIALLCWLSLRLRLTSD